VSGNLKNMTKFTKNEKIDVVREYLKGATAGHLAKRLGIHERTVRKWNVAYKDLAEIKEAYLPEGQQLKGTSTLYDQEGNIRMQWIKTNQEVEDAKKAIECAVNALNEDIPRIDPKKQIRETDKELLNLYIITDYHFGMMAREDEGGANWDMGIAEDLLIKWLAQAMQSSPDGEVGILCQLGDFLHWDGLDAVTPTSKHVLDADTKFYDLVSKTIKVFCCLVEMMLEKHNHVHIIMAEGNHDLASSVWLRALYSKYYENEPRVTVDNTPVPYYAYKWGDTSLFFHHGHKKRVNDLSHVFAGLYRDIFGKTKHSYAHTGHCHHKESKETNLMYLTQHTTLAAKDSHASRGGYQSKRDAKVITYSKKYGEVGSSTISPEMIK